MHTEYDVVIVGARVAGASLALQLGQRGYRVLLVDRDSFPSDTLSTHVLGSYGVGMLKRLGVLEDVEAAGFRRITRVRTWVEDCLFEGPVGPDNAYAMAPRRYELDASLIRHAVERGKVDFHERTSVEGLCEENGRVVGAIVRTADGERREVRAQVVVGADGKYSKVAEWVQAEKYKVLPAQRPAYYGYFHGIAPLPEVAIEFFFSHDRIGFIFPMRPDEDCLALELQPEEFEVFRANPLAMFEECFRALPSMAMRMKDAVLEGKLQGTRGIENYLRKPYGPGWTLTGDAAYLKDPCTGSGISDALEQSFMLADALDAALHGDDWEATLGAYQQQRDKANLPSYQGTLNAAQARDASPNAVNWLRASLINPHHTRQIMYWMPTMLSGGLPSHLQPMMSALGRAFDAHPLTEPEDRAAPTQGG